jgi:hypothetical protein
LQINNVSKEVNSKNLKKENVKTRISELHNSEAIGIKTEVKDEPEGRSRPKRPINPYQAFIKQHSASIIKER